MKGATPPSFNLHSAIALNIRGARQILDVDGAGGVVNRYRSFQIQLHVRTESGEIVLLEGSTMKKVASPTPVTDLGEEEK